MQPVRITTGPPARMRKWNHFSQYCRKDLSSLYLDGEARVKKRQEVKDQQFNIPGSTACLTQARSSCEQQPRPENSILCKIV